MSKRPGAEPEDGAGGKRIHFADESIHGPSNRLQGPISELEVQMAYIQNFEDCLDYECDEIEYEKKNAVKEGAEKSKKNQAANINDNQPSVKEFKTIKQKENEKKELIKRLDKIKEQQEKTKQQLMLKIYSFIFKYNIHFLYVEKCSDEGNHETVWMKSIEESKRNGKETQNKDGSSGNEQIQVAISRKCRSFAIDSVDPAITVLEQLCGPSYSRLRTSVLTLVRPFSNDYVELASLSIAYQSELRFAQQEG
ncbi:hypothetical protein HNY73_021989 [Argiope bruennichi]|uniref:Uncharacterized protein n=1 Tax=Argiope bruennichi TaxID=94029 RepID=A0A8T0E3K6_ARGBR|nr:hypothetical protein HNY73_021989 [Argiope bruennichi]